MIDFADYAVNHGVGDIFATGWGIETDYDFVRQLSAG